MRMCWFPCCCLAGRRMANREWRMGSSESRAHRAALPFAARHSLFALQRFLDFAQLFLAEEHLPADEEGRRAEGAALDGGLGVLYQFALHIRILRAGEQFCGVEARGGERLCRYFRVVHLL